MTAKLPLTGDEPADQLLEDDPLALLIGMLLDQQVPMEKAFDSPHDLKQRLGHKLDAADIASTRPRRARELFKERPALHRFPARWPIAPRSCAGASSSATTAMPSGSGPPPPQATSCSPTSASSRVSASRKRVSFTALLAKRLGVKPEGWEQAAVLTALPGHYSVADIDGPDSLVAVRAYKKEQKAKAKAKR